VISGGFIEVVEPIQKQLGLDYAFANKLEVKDGLLTGEVVGTIVNRKRKAELLEQIAKDERIELDQVIAVGDGANDLDMLDRAGLGIAFNAKRTVQELAAAAINQTSLLSILYLLGMRDIDTLFIEEEKA
jgi:phosphoserine phosphatase